MTDCRRETPDHERLPQERHPLARPAALKRLRWGLIGLMVLLLVASLFVHGHPHFALDAMAGFYAWFGVIAGGAAVAAGLVWAALFRRQEGYYD